MEPCHLHQGATSMGSASESGQRRTALKDNLLLSESSL